MILQIRGTSGTGKTTVMRAVMEAAECKPCKTEKGKRKERVVAYRGKWDELNVYVLGNYENEGTGGCDCINEIETVVQLVDEFASVTHRANGDHKAIILFEGLLLAHSWGRMGEFVHEKYGHRYMNAFLSTTCEQAVKNVLARRLKAGANNDDPERVAKIIKNIEADYYRVELAHKRVITRGGLLVDVPYKGASQWVIEYIQNYVETQRMLFR